MNEILLEEVGENYRELKAGEPIRVGDFFQRKAGSVTSGTPTRVRFELVTEDSEVNGQKLAGLTYLSSYPIVLRPLN